MILLTALAAALLLSLAWTDLRHRRLPNKAVLAYGLLCPLGLALQGAAPSAWLGHSIVAVIAFILLFALFAMGGMGGGDVKMGTVVFAWAGPALVLPVLLVVGLSGLAVALLGIVGERLLRRSRLPASSLTRRLARALTVQRGVPYGVALAMGGLAALPHYV